MQRAAIRHLYNAAPPLCAACTPPEMRMFRASALAIASCRPSLVFARLAKLCGVGVPLGGRSALAQGRAQVSPRVSDNPARLGAKHVTSGSESWSACGPQRSQGDFNVSSHQHQHLVAERAAHLNMSQNALAVAPKARLAKSSTTCNASRTGHAIARAHLRPLDRAYRGLRGPRSRLGPRERRRCLAILREVLEDDAQMRRYTEPSPARFDGWRARPPSCGRGG